MKKNLLNNVEKVSFNCLLLMALMFISVNGQVFGKLSLKIISAFRLFHIKDLSSTPIFADPTCLYQTFVDAYQRKKGKYIAKQEIAKQTANLWSKIMNEKEE